MGIEEVISRVSIWSGLMWACQRLDYKHRKPLAIIEKTKPCLLQRQRLLHLDVLWGKWQWFCSGLMRSDNNKGSSNNWSTKAQSSSIRFRLSTQVGFTSCFLCWCTWLWGAPGDGLLNFYEAHIPLRYHLRIEATARTQLRDCRRKLLIKQMSFLPYAMRQEHHNKHALIKHTWRMRAVRENKRHFFFVATSQQEWESDSFLTTGLTCREYKQEKSCGIHPRKEYCS